jgi:glucokinase
MLLVGDIGGTTTRLGFFARAPERPVLVDAREFITLDHPELGAMIDAFLQVAEGAGEAIEAACFGVAGPVLEDAATLTNVPWRVDAREISARFGFPVSLLNDLVAMAYAVPVLRGRELAVLQEGDGVADGNAALIAAGTGLGEAALHNIDGRFVPVASEGGHADFAARTQREIELVRELTRQYGRADVEHVISGSGFINLYRFTHKLPCPVVDPDIDPADLPAQLTKAAMDGSCPSCMDAFDLFLSAYGAEAGNLALRMLATAGVYLGGGIAPKILPALRAGAFIDAFRSKPPMTDLLAAVPVRVILNEHAGLIGAAVYLNG